MGNAHFEVEVVATPAPVVSFYKNGTQITESSHYNLKSSGNTYSLDLLCCTEADVCQYTCTAKNAAGSAMTSAQLTIVEAYEQFQSPEPQEQQQRGKLSLLEITNCLQAILQYMLHIDRVLPLCEIS